jgi:hypothetical protein
LSGAKAGGGVEADRPFPGFAMPNLGYLLLDSPRAFTRPHEWFQQAAHALGVDYQESAETLERAFIKIVPPKRVPQEK